jgi:hypothetical protein
MITIFTATLKIKVTHDKDTHIDTNSVKGLIGPGVTAIRQRGINCLCEVGDKTEGMPEAMEIMLTKLTEGKDVIEIDDIDEYE